MIFGRENQKGHCRRTISQHNGVVGIDADFFCRRFQSLFGIALGLSLVPNS